MPVAASITDLIVTEKGKSSEVLEIKSECDSFDRLASQLPDYYKVFRKFSLVTGEKLFKKAMPAYVTVHIFLNTKIELILWKLMYVSEHGYRIDPENFSRANALRFVFQIPSRFQKGQVQRILKRLSRRISE